MTHEIRGLGVEKYAYPGLRDRILLNYTRIENAHKICKKTFDFMMYRSLQTRNQGGAKPPLGKFSSGQEKCVDVF